MIHNVFEVNNRGQPTPVSIDIDRHYALVVAGPSGSGRVVFKKNYRSHFIL